MTDHNVALTFAIIAAGMDPRNPAVHDAWQKGIAEYLELRNAEAVAWRAQMTYGFAHTSNSTQAGVWEREGAITEPLFPAPSAGGETVKVKQSALEASQMRLFGHWSKHRLADGVFLPLVCYVPTGPDYTTVPLYAADELPSPSPSADTVNGSLRILLDQIAGAEADKDDDHEAGERDDLFDYEIALPLQAAKSIAALLTSALTPSSETDKEKGR